MDLTDSLTALFNGFRPLFAALTPDQVNELAQDVIERRNSLSDDRVEKARLQG